MSLASAHALVERSVFVNCPFDETYLPLLRAMVYTIHDCGFIARLAIEDVGSNETRIDKIARIIQESRLSIHDISRVELTDSSPLPRFNMPFECGLAMGWIRYGDSELQRDFLLLDAERHRDKLTLSDLAGQDPKYHQNEPQQMVSAVRSFLASKKASGERTRGADAISERLRQFELELPSLCQEYEISYSQEIHRFDYLSDWIWLMAEWLLKPQLK